MITRYLLADALVLLLASSAAAQSMPASPAPPGTATSPVASAAGSTPIVVPIHGRGGLAIVVPSGWRHEISRSDGKPVTTVTLAPRKRGRAGKILLTPLWSPDGGDITSQEALRAAAASSASRLGGRPDGVRPLEGATGSWITLRVPPDMAKELNDYKYLTSAFAGVDDIRVVATFLAVKDDSPVRATGFDVLRSLRAVSEEPSTLPVAVTSAPGAWDLRLDLPTSFSVSPRQESESGVGVEASTPEGWVLTAFVEPNQGGATAKGHRDFVAEYARQLVAATAGTPSQGQLRTWEEGDRACVEYAITANGALITRSRNVLLVHDGQWVDVHISHSPPTLEDAATFDAITRSIRIE